MGQSLAPPLTYHDKVFEEVDRILDQATRIIESTYWGGDAIPSFYPSFGPDEIAVFCGAQLNWSPDSVDTNWSEAVVSEWEESLPIGLITNHPLFQKQLELYRQASSRFQGAVTLVAPDMHTNMDLLAALRGPQRLCIDLLDCPDLIDLA